MDDLADAHLGPVTQTVIGVDGASLGKPQTTQVAGDIHGMSAHAMIEVYPAGSMYLIWGEPTDRVELKPDEHDQAIAEMVRAAREWLSLDLANHEAVARYLDYWVHDVCGYARRAGAGAD